MSLYTMQAPTAADIHEEAVDDLARFIAAMLDMPYAEARAEAERDMAKMHELRAAREEV